LAVALVHVGALPFHKSLGVSFGANLGTTSYSQFFAFDLGQYTGFSMLSDFLLSFDKKRSARK
jgi:Na+/phosphate symporter